MKPYAVIAWDAPGSAGPREAAREPHFAHLEATADTIAVAGPLRDEAGGFVGSLFILQAEDEADARARLEADPYFAAGVWSRFDIREFLPAIGTWIGGKIW